MKKTMSILLVCLMACTLLSTAALADELPQPDGGKKFEGGWAIRGGLVEVLYEEEGYRVIVDLSSSDGLGGTFWEYSCYYEQERNALVSVTSARRAYTKDASTLERTNGEMQYDDADEDGQKSIFTIVENGNLHWTNGRDTDIGDDLEFSSIGSFRGAWRSAEGEEPVWVTMNWMGLDDEESFFYSVYLHRGDDSVYTEYTMTGVYNPETGKLVCTGHNVDSADTEEHEAIFSMAGNGQLMYEAANGILLDFDLLGDDNG